MHLFEVGFYTAGTLYALFSEQILIFYFLVVVGIYLLISTYGLPGSKDISTRKKMMVGGWTHPSEGVIHNKMTVRVEKVQKLI
jgi:hypothetical protein